MPSIQKHGNGRYRVFIRRQGHPSQSRVFDTKGEAAKWARAVESKVDAGDIHVSSRKTVTDVIDRYLDENPGLIKYERKVLEWWREQIGSRKVSQIRKAHIVAARTKLRTEPSRNGGTVSPSTVNRRVALLSRVFTIAEQEWDWMSANPARIRALKEDNERERLLTKAEQKRLLGAIDKYYEPAIKPFVLMALYAGMRAGEIQKLNWGDVDLGTGHISILDSKNGDRRATGIGGGALSALTDYAREHPGLPSAAVFRNSTTGHAPFEYRQHWAKLMKAAKLENFRFHDLRHCFTTTAIKAGMPISMVSEITGHRSPRMLQRYTHLSTDVALQVSHAVADANDS
jgi:integrase